MKRLAVALIVIIIVSVSGIYIANNGNANIGFIEQTDLFVAKGQAHYRIPSIVVAKDGTVLAFCNRRLHTVGDNAAEVHVVLRRSLDEGKTWQPMKDLFAREGWVAGHGSVIVDDTNGTIMLFYSRRPVSDSAKAQAEKEGIEIGRFMARSTDNGETWVHTKAAVAPNDAGKAGHTHGSGTGITLQFGPKKGRLLLPARYVTQQFQESSEWSEEGQELLRTCHFNCAIYSDDHGKTWKTGEAVQTGTGEGCLVETSDGTIYYNSRAYFFDGKRRVAWSYDGGATFRDFSVEETLIEPIFQGCNAALTRYPQALAGGKNMILFSNPANFSSEHLKLKLTSFPGDTALGRTRMTVRLSYDEAKTWPVSRVVNEGPSGYSSLAVSGDGTILCMYETGKNVYNEKIAVARFNMDWLTNSEARLKKE